MDRRYVINPYISMDDLSKPWELNHCLIINPKYLEEIKKKEKESENNKEKGLTLAKSKTKL